MDAASNTDRDSVEKVMMQINDKAREFLRTLSFSSAGSNNKQLATFEDLFEPKDINLKEEGAVATLTFVLNPPESQDGLAGHRSINYSQRFQTSEGPKEMIVEYGFYQITGNHVSIQVDSSGETASVKAGSFIKNDINYFARVILITEQNVGTIYEMLNTTSPTPQATASTLEALDPELVPILIEEMLEENNFSGPFFEDSQKQIMVMAKQAFKGDLKIPATVESEFKPELFRSAVNCSSLF